MVNYAVLHTGLHFEMGKAEFVYFLMQAGYICVGPVSLLCIHVCVLQRGSVVSDCYYYYYY
jgi:hypothetical protein